MQVSLSYIDFISFEYIPWRGRSGQYSRSMVSSLKNFYTVLHNGYHNLYSHQISPLSKRNWLWIWGFITVVPIMLHWSMYVFLCQYYTGLDTIVLHYVLKSAIAMLPALSFLVKTAKTIWGLLCFHINFRIFF